MAFMVTGYSECIDSFFAFGLFETAKRSGFFPAELVDTFEPVVHEEGRHILFFVNWVAWHRRTMPGGAGPGSSSRCLGVWAFLVWERLGIAKDLGNGQQDNNFTVNGAEQLGKDIDVGQLMDICLAENDPAPGHLRQAPQAPALRALHDQADPPLHTMRTGAIVAAVAGLALAVWFVAMPASRPCSARSRRSAGAALRCCASMRWRRS